MASILSSDKPMTLTLRTAEGRAIELSGHIQELSTSGAVQSMTTISDGGKEHFIAGGPGMRQFSLTFRGDGGITEWFDQSHVSDIVEHMVEAKPSEGWVCLHCSTLNPNKMLKHSWQPEPEQTTNCSRCGAPRPLYLGQGANHE